MSSIMVDVLRDMHDADFVGHIADHVYALFLHGFMVHVVDQMKIASADALNERRRFARGGDQITFHAANGFHQHLNAMRRGCVAENFERFPHLIQRTAAILPRRHVARLRRADADITISKPIRPRTQRLHIGFQLFRVIPCPVQSERRRAEAVEADGLQRAGLQLPLRRLKRLLVPCGDVLGCQRNGFIAERR